MDGSFDYTGAVKINIDRINWLKRLNVNYKNKNVLETGVGARGDFTTYLEDNGANLYLIEARQVNIDEHIRRFPYRKDKFYCINMNNDGFLDKIPIDKYDVIVCLGTLYHLSRPNECLNELCKRTNVLLLETQVLDIGEWNFCLEPTQHLNQSFDGFACRPNVNLLRNILNKYFKYVDETIQPENDEFKNGLRRCFYCHN